MSSSSSTEICHGRVKWFNNKAGYGFITMTSDSDVTMDVFVHHSALNVSEEQYKYLVQGEYVEFSLARVEGGPHEWQASSVRGLHGGKLMCETRRDVRSQRTTRVRSNSNVENPTPTTTPTPLQVRTPPRRAHRIERLNPSIQTQAPLRHPQPVHYYGDNTEWMLVRRVRGPEQSHTTHSAHTTYNDSHRVRRPLRRVRPVVVNDVTLNP
jgi:cold shock CspA family protein